MDINEMLKSDPFVWKQSRIVNINKRCWVVFLKRLNLTITLHRGGWVLYGFPGGYYQGFGKLKDAKLSAMWHYRGYLESLKLLKQGC